MYLGLMTGSYTKNMSGGVLRKNIYGISDEIRSTNGQFHQSRDAFSTRKYHWHH